MANKVTFQKQSDYIWTSEAANGGAQINGGEDFFGNSVYELFVWDADFKSLVWGVEFDKLNDAKNYAKNILK